MSPGGGIAAVAAVPPLAGAVLPGAGAGRPSLTSLARTLRSAGYADLFLAQVAPLGVSFLLTLVSAVLLGPERRGVLTFLMTGALLCGALAYGSLHVPVVEGLRAGDRGSLRHGVRLVAAIWVVLTVLGAAVALADLPTPGAAVPGSAFEIGMVLVGGAIAVTQLFGGRVLQGLGETRRYVRVVVVQSLLYLAGSGTVLLTTRSPLLMYAAWYGSVLAGLALASWLLRAALRERQPGAAAGATWRRFVSSALANNLGSIGQMVMLRADVLVVGVLLGPVPAGVYGIALSLTELSLIAPEVFSLAVYGNRARMDETRWREQLRRSVHWNAAAAVVVAVGITLVAAILASGPLASYHGLVPLVLVILPGAFFAGYTRIALGALQALGATVPVWQFGVLALVLSLGFLPAALLGGTAGPAVVSSLAYAVTALFLYTRLRARLGDGAEVLA